MASGTLIGADRKGKPIDQKTYRAIIGSLLYLTASRPDIMFATCFCASFQENPKESHMLAVKRILRYLKGTPNRGLWYPKEFGFELVEFSNVDHGGCQRDRKSTSGHVQFLGDKLVRWGSKKQHCVSISTAEAEYVATASCCSQVLWMKTQLRDYGYNFNHIPIYCDSKSAIAITCNPVQHTRTKHIDIRYHFIKDHVERGTIELYFVKTEYQLADLFTKPLDEKRLNFLISKLGISSTGPEMLPATGPELLPATESQPTPTNTNLWNFFSVVYAKAESTIFFPIESPMAGPEQTPVTGPPTESNPLQTSAIPTSDRMSFDRTEIHFTFFFPAVVM
ncbi:hypothetical protein OSB04_024039 [Centaurea solstitialis]|uniref:Retrovirus-related Pol polyprotein from transposon TNT 1-94 n=1 Tax=Centaurea solstitialis TaxID=347529 RepID=A0AA38T3U2_9ASTR|nr:hypothetical protein OSB04_024039 [Centaurea solstitialis]